ncbi:hypothetical protein PENVUL_c001G01644 [Penicillium vulpinum]|uniref:Uncharacterized protein n=2 Tax=Penicillium vulpinum TaxID=29845 RepID=A0A1V6SE67_9EURO|nr:hypothetical protein PENVUL_c001G01644 [Penicillium vulpinum]
MGLKSGKDISYEPATEEEIATAEEQVGELPTDFMETVRLDNGFKGGCHLFAGGQAGTRNITTEENGFADAGYEYYEDEMGFYLYNMIKVQSGT